MINEGHFFKAINDEFLNANSGEMIIFLVGLMTCNSLESVIMGQ